MLAGKPQDNGRKDYDTIKSDERIGNIARGHDAFGEMRSKTCIFHGILPHRQETKHAHGDEEYREVILD